MLHSSPNTSLASLEAAAAQHAGLHMGGGVGLGLHPDSGLSNVDSTSQVYSHGQHFASESSLMQQQQQHLEGAGAGTAADSSLTTGAAAAAATGDGVGAGAGPPASGFSSVPDLARWPELLELTEDLARSRHTGVYRCSWLGAPLAAKVYRLVAPTSLEGAGGGSVGGAAGAGGGQGAGVGGLSPEMEAVVASQYRLCTLRHQYVLKHVAVFPYIFEVGGGLLDRAGACWGEPGTDWAARGRQVLEATAQVLLGADKGVLQGRVRSLLGDWEALLQVVAAGARHGLLGAVQPRGLSGQVPMQLGAARACWDPAGAVGASGGC